MNKFKILDAINIILYKIYNVASQMIFNIKDYKIKKFTARNIELKLSKNRKGECFVIGNGPSLKGVDLKLIKDYDTFTVNYFHKGKKSNDLKSTYHVIIDETFYKGEHLNYITDLYNSQKSTKFIFRHKAISELKGKNTDFTRAYFTYQKLMQYDNYIKLDMTKNITACVNVVLCCIQSAIYMGYKRIYLIGCDFNSFATLNPLHFYTEGISNRVESVGVELKGSAPVLFHHYALQNYALNHGIEILNATEGSLIDAYKRINLEDILNNKN